MGNTPSELHAVTERHERFELLVGRLGQEVVGEIGRTQTFLLVAWPRPGPYSTNLCSQGQSPVNKPLTAADMEGSSAGEINVPRSDSEEEIALSP